MICHCGPQFEQGNNSVPDVKSNLCAGNIANAL